MILWSCRHPLVRSSRKILFHKYYSYELRALTRETSALGSGIHVCVDAGVGDGVLTSHKGDTCHVWPWVGQVTTVKADLLKGQEHQSRTWPHILHPVRQIKPPLSISERVSGTDRVRPSSVHFMRQDLAVLVSLYLMSTCPYYHVIITFQLQFIFEFVFAHTNTGICLRYRYSKGFPFRPSFSQSLSSSEREGCMYVLSVCQAVL